MNKLKHTLSQNERLREMLSYVLFGALTTLVNWATYFIITSLLQPEQYATDSTAHWLILNGAQSVSWILSVLFAFFTNKAYVFKSKAARGSAVRELVLFVSARLLSFLLFDLLLYNLCVFSLGIDHKWSKLVMNVLVVIFNYFASKYVIFKNKQQYADNN